GVLWAFIMLAMTGALPLHVVAIFLLIFTGALFREQWKLPDLTTPWRIMNVLVLFAGAYGWFVLRERLDTVVYMFLYLTLNKLWTAEKHRDYLQLYTLGFFMVLATSVSTASISFAPMVMVYVLLMIATLLVFTMRRDGEAAFNL